MAYSFSGFMGSFDPIQQICNQYIFARNIPLGQGIFLIPLTDELQGQMNGDTAGEPVDGFALLTGNIESVVASASALGAITYAEVTYWAGEGSEAGAVWEQGRRVRTIRFGKGVINILLRQLGCTPGDGEDEFLSMGFGLRRFTDDWLKG